MHGLAKGRREGYQFRPRKHLPNLVFTHCLAWSWDFVTISLETVGQRWKRLGFERRGCKKGFSFICWPLVGGRAQRKSPLANNRLEVWK